MPEQTNPTPVAPQPPKAAANRAQKAATNPPTPDNSRAKAAARLAELEDTAKKHLPGHGRNDPKFYSIDGEPVKVDLPDGRTVQVGPEARPLHPAFWRAALQAGCGSTSRPDPRTMKELAAAPATDQVQRRALIEKTIMAALDAEEGDPAYDGFFMPNGLINIEKLSAKVGFKVERTERDEVFRQVRKELEDADAAGGQGADDVDDAQSGARQ